jgi:hypothetical protein
MANAESAVAQTVAWVEDLLSISSSDNSSSTPVDPTTSILNSAYGQNSSTTAADPTTSILDSAYGDGDGASTTGASSSGAAASATVSNALSFGNAGSGASVNVYA